MQVPNGNALTNHGLDELAPEGAIRKTARLLGMSAGYLNQHDLNDMLADAGRLVRRFPQHSLIAAATVGLLLGSAFRRR